MPGPYTIAGAGSELSAEISISPRTILPKIAKPARISSGSRPAKLNRRALRSTRDTAKYRPGA
jgi:hypothetical protein